MQPYESLKIVEPPSSSVCERPGLTWQWERAFTYVLGGAPSQAHDSSDDDLAHKHRGSFPRTRCGRTHSLVDRLAHLQRFPPPSAPCIDIFPRPV